MTTSFGGRLFTSVSVCVTKTQYENNKQVIIICIRIIWKKIIAIINEGSNPVQAFPADFFQAFFSQLQKLRL